MENTNADVKFDLLDEQIKELKTQNKELEKRLTTIETSREKTEFQYEQIMKAIDKLNEDTIPKLMKELEIIKNKPAKRWETGINALISGVVAIVISLIFEGISN